MPGFPARGAVGKSRAGAQCAPFLPRSRRVFMEYRKFMCIVCGYIYDEAEGAPDDGIAAGTRWEDVPDDWVCPDCAAPKEDFEMMEI